MPVLSTASAPVRATDRTTLVWGLVTIPLSIYTGTEKTKVERKEFVIDTDVSVGRSPIRKDTGEVIDVNVVQRRAQSTDGVFVPLGDDEIAAATQPKGQANIVTFIPAKFLDRYLTENQAQVRPRSEKGKVDPNVAKAFALLLSTMKKMRVAAIVKLAVRGPARYAILTSEGDLRYIYTADAIREPRPVETDFNFDANEKAMASTLVSNIGIALDPPVLTDDTAAAIQQYVDAKAAGIPQPEQAEPVSSGDLLSALSASVAASVKNRAVAS